jgi:hypothetical protein
VVIGFKLGGKYEILQEIPAWNEHSNNNIKHCQK